MQDQDITPAGEGAIIEEPLILGSADAVQWDVEADVIVVGFGGAGACAAIEAADQGCNVVIVDRFEGGGATALSGGVHYAGGTKVQAEAGIVDRAQDMYNYLRIETGDAVSDETLLRFCHESGSNIEWLRFLGVEFGGNPYTSKTVYPPDGHFLYYSGNEPLPAYAAKARPAVRGHRVVGKGYTGHVYFSILKKAVEQRFIPIQRHTKVVRLVQDTDRRVIGVEAIALPVRHHKDHLRQYKNVGPMPFTFEKAEKSIARARTLENENGLRIRLRARRGVILTTGGFCYNTHMLKQYMPNYAKFASAMLRMGSMGCDGSGIQLGQSVGGEGRKLSNNFYGRIISPPAAFVEGMIVNRHGRRFYNEDAYNAELGEAIAEQPDGMAWLILDAEVWRKLRKQLVPKGDGQFVQWYLPALVNVIFGGSRKGRTLYALAKKCGIDERGLQEEAQTSHATIASGHGDPLGKSSDYFRALGEGPYHAINMSVWNKFMLAPFLTLGGLTVGEMSGQVISVDGKPIHGLYAAGRAAIGVCANRYMSGMSLSDGVFSARRAARHIAGRTLDTECPAGDFS
ncbi:3-oxo-5alpha-steroid 4-dehydrogenase [Advenella incenata]|uniref:3-oxo-5alpha-steroid 4-dehydrogenase n=1 Tax=Advenella incenata TaxID=267800 RepID=A0A4Q7VFV8_9BURK|nr:FAD-binding protein [Advenella incenata]RZT94879.1 3-oxo-5alpha-steroid 4-dehydrogenase [Advenella incenata]